MSSGRANIHIYATTAERDQLREVSVMLCCSTMSQAAKRAVKIVAKLLEMEGSGRYVGIVDPKRKKIQRILMV